MKNKTPDSSQDKQLQDLLMNGGRDGAAKDFNAILKKAADQGKK
jgi:hypothetical protein